MITQVQTFSVVCGTNACNAKCPFCVSRMTENKIDRHDLSLKNFKASCQFAKQCKANTLLITGCGEPTLYPEDISIVLYLLNHISATIYEFFPFRELQTNGIDIARGKLDNEIIRWKDNGLTTICLSVAHYDYDFNKQIYTPDSEYIDLEDVIKKIKEIGYTVRLGVIGLRGGVDNIDGIKKLIEWCKVNDVDQITYRPVSQPYTYGENKVAKWVTENFVQYENLEKINSYVKENGTLLWHLPHGASIYDINGQNFCMTNCLTEDVDPNNLRQLIYFPDGHLRYSWQYEGAVLL